MYFKRSQLDALIERLRERRRFISPAGLFVYMAGTVLLLIVLYPGEQVHSIIRDMTEYDAFSVKYFENHLATKPDDLIVRRALARVYLKMQDIEKLERILPPLVSAQDEVMRREAQFFELFVFLNHVQPQYVNAPELLHKELEQKIRAIGPLQQMVSAYQLIEFGDQAVIREKLIMAVQLYLLAMEAAADSQQKRQAFLKAVDAMQQTGDARVAFRLAEYYAGAIPMDRQTAWYLMNLARKAEQIGAARKYAVLLLRMETNASY